MPRLNARLTDAKGSSAGERPFYRTSRRSHVPRRRPAAREAPCTARTPSCAFWRDLRDSVRGLHLLTDGGCPGSIRGRFGTFRAARGGSTAPRNGPEGANRRPGTPRARHIYCRNAFLMICATVYVAFTTDKAVKNHDPDTTRRTPKCREARAFARPARARHALCVYGTPSITHYSPRHTRRCARLSRRVGGRRVAVRHAVSSL